MASQIDPTKPGEGQAYTADVRGNFAAAKSEIEILESTATASQADITALQAELAALQAAFAAPRMGAIDGSEAGPGEIGEYIVTSNMVGVELAMLVPLTVCPLSLSPGDWEIWGTVNFTPPGSVSPNMVCASISIHDNGLPTDEDLMTGVGVINKLTTSSLTSGEQQILMTGTCRSNSAAPLDVYLVAETTFAGASNRVNAKGYICARRAR